MFFPYSEPRRFPFALSEETVERLQLKIYREDSYSMTYSTECAAILIKVDILVEHFSPVFSIVMAKSSIAGLCGLETLINTLADINYLPAVNLTRKDKIDEILNELEL